MDADLVRRISLIEILQVGRWRCKLDPGLKAQSFQKFNLMKRHVLSNLNPVSEPCARYVQDDNEDVPEPPEDAAERWCGRSPIASNFPLSI